MDPKFRALVESLEPKYLTLLAMEPVRFGSLPPTMPERGIYLFSEGGRHLYVGRTNRVGMPHKASKDRRSSLDPSGLRQVHFAGNAVPMPMVIAAQIGTRPPGLSSGTGTFWS